MIGTISNLRSAQLIQAHHWQAAEWVKGIPADHIAQKNIKAGCMLIGARTHRIGRHGFLDPYKLLFKACVARETFEQNEPVIGVLREVLNMVHREMLLHH